MKEWTLVQWFYRRFICPRWGHEYKDWKCLGLPGHPYCIHCGTFHPTWEAPEEKSFAWKIDTLAEQALKDNREGKSRSIREIAEEKGINL